MAQAAEQAAQQPALAMLGEKAKHLQVAQEETGNRIRRLEDLVESLFYTVLRAPAERVPDFAAPGCSPAMGTLLEDLEREIVGTHHAVVAANDRLAALEMNVKTFADRLVGPLESPPKQSTPKDEMVAAPSRNRVTGR